MATAMMSIKGAVMISPSAAAMTSTIRLSFR